MEYSIKHNKQWFPSEEVWVNLIYDNDEKKFLSWFEPIIENACLPCNDDYILFLFYNKIIFYNQIRIKKITVENTKLNHINSK